MSFKVLLFVTYSIIQDIITDLQYVFSSLTQPFPKYYSTNYLFFQWSSEKSNLVRIRMSVIDVPYFFTMPLFYLDLCQIQLQKQNFLASTWCTFIIDLDFLPTFLGNKIVGASSTTGIWFYWPFSFSYAPNASYTPLLKSFGSIKCIYLYYSI